MTSILKETITDVVHWTDTLFSIKATRDQGFRFENGMFAMIGLEVDGKPLMRAYSMVSANYEDHLEFLSIKVPNGPLTSRLKNVQVGDTLLVNRKAVGTLLIDNLRPGERLYLLSTGTGLAPFMSIIKDPTTYENFNQVILTHTTRTKAELVYEDVIQDQLPNNEFFGEMVRGKLRYYPTVTREEFANRGRITDLIYSGKLFADLGVPAFNPEEDRVMICGNPHMMTELSDHLKRTGFVMGTHAHPGDYVIEKAFAEK